VAGRVAWITVAPVKGLALARRDEVELGPRGVAENRRFHLVDAGGRLVNGKTLGRLVTVAASWDAETDRLELRFPDGRSVAGRIELGEPVETSFYGRPVAGREVAGPWSDALSAAVGRPLRLVRPDEAGAGVDRGRGAVTLLSTGALDELAAAAGVAGPVDPRRFRMLFGVDGVPPHAEDGWIGREVRIGEAVVRPLGHVGRCAVTTQNPETGTPDLDTLRAIGRYRGALESTEPLPFGVYGEVVAPGRVRLGDPVEPA
jgi:uncharacterized protein YcbX